MRTNIQSGQVGTPPRLVSNALRLFLALVLSSGPLSANESSLSELFPRRGLEGRIEFWKQIFTKYGERDVVIHDQNDLRLIYEVVSFDTAPRSDAREALRQKQQRAQKELELKKILSDLSQAWPNMESLTPRHNEALNLLQSLGYSPSSASFRKLAENIRSQRGIKEKFSEGVIRSGKYLSLMQDIFRREDLPPELAFLPHVESSFDFQARSAKSAAGIWQFIPTTGRRFLQITSYVDERLDPLRAMEAAAQFLKENHSRLGNWPLAITAYNHGPNGMLRAKQLHGEDLLAIINQYQSPLFGFASKNFYAEFLAALEIAQDHERFLGPLKIADALQFETIHPDRTYRASQLTKVSGLSQAVLSEYNPHVAPSVWKGTHSFPAGSPLRVPLGKGDEVAHLLKGGTTDIKSARVVPSDGSSYRVQAGDTLDRIARKFGSTVQALQRINEITNPHELRAGRVLLLAERSSGHTQYQVRRGDTLTAIARRFGASLEAILQLNRVVNGHRIFPGQILLIPVEA